MWLGNRLSSPVLGTEADALKIALGLLWERRQQCREAFPVLVVHDEVVVEAPAEAADAASVWLKLGLRVVPDMAITEKQAQPIATPAPSPSTPPTTAPGSA